jgi:KipI family sensor histidine kinase inhibitor
MTKHMPDIAPLGADGLLVRFATTLDDAANRAVLEFAAALETDTPTGVAEISTALASVFVRFDRSETTRVALMQSLQSRLDAQDWLSLPEPAPNRRWQIPAAFGGAHGPQLAAVAGLLEMSEDEVVADLVAHPVRVLAIGFAPGQPYMGMLPDRWDIPRQQEITASVPAGALVAAVRQLIIFTAKAPTGWRQVGQTAFRPYRPDADQPFPLLPGDVLQFDPVSAEEFDRIRQSDTDGSGGARLEVLS